MRNSETPERPDRPTRRPTFTRRRLIAGGGALAAGVVAGGPNIAWAMPKDQTGARPTRRFAASPGQDLPREQTLILQNPEGVLSNPAWFNVWMVGVGGGWSTGLHQLMMDTFWYIDPDAGVNGVTQNSLATGPAEYNDDYSEMTVNLRDGIYWSDGEKFDATTSSAPSKLRWRIRQ